MFHFFLPWSHQCFGKYVLKIKLLLLTITFYSSCLFGTLGMCLDSCGTIQPWLSPQDVFPHPWRKKILFFPLRTLASFSTSVMCGVQSPLHLQGQGQWEVRRNLVGLLWKSPRQCDVNMFKIWCWVACCYHNKGPGASRGNHIELKSTWHNSEKRDEEKPGPWYPTLPEAHISAQPSFVSYMSQ